MGFTFYGTVYIPKRTYSCIRFSTPGNLKAIAFAVNENPAENMCLK